MGRLDRKLDTFKNIIWDTLVKAGLTALFLKFPFLNWWPLNWLVKYFIEKFTDQFYEMVGEFIQIKSIVLNNENAKNEFVKQSVILKMIAGGHGIDSEEYKLAREKSREKMREFINFDIVRTN